MSGGVPARTLVFMPFTSYVEHAPVLSDVETLIAAAGVLGFPGRVAPVTLLKAAAVVEGHPTVQPYSVPPFLDGAKVLKGIKGITEVTLYFVIAIVVAGIDLIVSSFETALWFLG